MKGSAGTGSGGSTPKQPFKVRRFFLTIMMVSLKVIIKTRLISFVFFVISESRESGIAIGQIFFIFLNHETSTTPRRRGLSHL